MQVSVNVPYQLNSESNMVWRSVTGKQLCVVCIFRSPAVLQVGPKGKVIGIDHIQELIDDSVNNVKKDDPSLITSGRVKLLGECKMYILKIVPESGAGRDVELLRGAWLSGCLMSAPLRPWYHHWPQSACSVGKVGIVSQLAVCLSKARCVLALQWGTGGWALKRRRRMTPFMWERQRPTCHKQWVCTMALPLEMWPTSTMYTLRMQPLRS